MFDKISRHLKQEAIIMNAKGVKQADIAASLHISESTIRRAKAKQRKYGDIDAGQQKRGRKQALPSGIQDVYSLFPLCIS